MALMYDMETVNKAMTDAASVLVGGPTAREKRILERFAAMQMVDAKPIVRARWKVNADGIRWCSACGRLLPHYKCYNEETDEEWDEQIDETLYCPHCGAIMDGRVEE